MHALADDKSNAGRPFGERQANARTVEGADERVICKDFSRLEMGCT
jgi:hypothetical protein